MAEQFGHDDNPPPPLYLYISIQTKINYTFCKPSVATEVDQGHFKVRKLISEQYGLWNGINEADSTKIIIYI